MKCYPTRWLWGLIPIAMLSWIAVQNEADRIEHDLEQRSRTVLAAAGHDWASIVFSGRYGVLVGTARHEHDPAAARALVFGVWGVRGVEARTRLAAEPAATEPPAFAAHEPKLTALRPAPAERATGVLPADTPAASALGDALPSLLAPAEPPAVAEPRPERVAVVAREITGAAVSDANSAGPGQPAGRTTTGTPAADAPLETAAVPAEQADPGGRAEQHAACRSAVLRVGQAGRIRFARAEADLDRRGRALLGQLAAVISACPHLSLDIGGHTDAEGTAQRNLALSRRRACAAVSYLINKGIDGARLQAVGYGETRPVAPNDTAGNRAKNRRIEVEIRDLAAIPQVPSSVSKARSR